MPAPPATRNASRLLQPAGLQDMLLYRINRLRAIGGGMVLRYCEGQFGVTRREWVMLALLAPGDGLQPSELAARAELDRPATSKAITALAAKGLIEREARPGDRRVAQVRLTPEGRALYDAILPLVEGVNREMLDGLHADEIAALDSMLARIQERADQMAARMADMPRADRRRGGTRRHRPG